MAEEAKPASVDGNREGNLVGRPDGPKGRQPGCSYAVGNLRGCPSRCHGKDARP